MATLRDVRRKIGSIRSTQTITRTMKMISASKLRRAQEDLERVRAYAVKMDQLLKGFAGRLPEDAHPLLQPREEVKRVLLFPIASDRGLSGAFNLNVATAVERFVEENKSEYDAITTYLVGRKIRDYFRRRKITTIKEWVDVRTFDRGFTDDMARELVDYYLNGEFDKVYLIYTSFISAIKQSVVFEEFLPIKVEKGDEEIEYLYEPDRDTIVNAILPAYIKTKVYYAMVQSQTSEHAARMAAMENATNNCGDMIDHLTLVYNKTRQASITNEMMDIVGGAEALQST